MVKVKIFINKDGYNEQLEKEINGWIKERDLGILNIDNIQYSITYDQNSDNCIIGVLILYED